MDCNIIHSVNKSKINMVLVFVSVFSIYIDFYHFSRLYQRIIIFYHELLSTDIANYHYLH